jgi:hypothetical protein
MALFHMAEDVSQNFLLKLIFIDDYKVFNSRMGGYAKVN